MKHTKRQLATCLALTIALFAFVLSRFIGTTGVWLGFLLGEGLTLILIVVYVLAFEARKTAGKALSVDSFMFLGPDFGVPAENLFEKSIHNLEEVSEASSEAADFCRAHGQSPRDSMLIPLCIEEIANNIVEYGFPRDKERHSVNVRILLKGEDRVIRVRDNCLRFDPVQYLKLHQADDDPAAHIGIRMVMKIVKSANYVNSIGLNNLTLVL